MKYFHIISKEQPAGQVLKYFRAEFDKSGVKTYAPKDGHCIFAMDIDGKSYGFNPKDIDIERVYFTLNPVASTLNNFRIFLCKNNMIIQRIAAFDIELLVNVILANFEPILTDDILSIMYGNYRIKLQSGPLCLAPKFSLEYMTSCTKKPFVPSPSKYYNFAKECQKHNIELSVKSLFDTKSREHVSLCAIVRVHQNAFEQLHTILKGEKVDPMLLLPCVTEQLKKMGIN